MEADSNYNLLYRMFCVAEALFLFPFGQFVISYVPPPKKKKIMSVLIIIKYDFLTCLNHFCFMDMFISIQCK